MDVPGKQKKHVVGHFSFYDLEVPQTSNPVAKKRDVFPYTYCTWLWLWWTPSAPISIFASWSRHGMEMSRIFLRYLEKQTVPTKYLPQNWCNFDLPTLRINHGNSQNGPPFEKNSWCPFSASETSFGNFGEWVGVFMDWYVLNYHVELNELN